MKIDQSSFSLLLTTFAIPVFALFAPADESPRKLLGFTIVLSN